LKNLFVFLSVLFIIFSNGDHPKGGYKEERKPRSKEETIQS